VTLVCIVLVRSSRNYGHVCGCVVDDVLDLQRSRMSDLPPSVVPDDELTHRDTEVSRSCTLSCSCIVTESVHII